MYTCSGISIVHYTKIAPSHYKLTRCHALEQSHAQSRTLYRVCPGTQFI